MKEIASAATALFLTQTALAQGNHGNSHPENGSGSHYPAIILGVFFALPTAAALGYGLKQCYVKFFSGSAEADVSAETSLLNQKV